MEINDIYRQFLNERIHKLNNVVKITSTYSEKGTFDVLTYSKWHPVRKVPTNFIYETNVPQEEIGQLMGGN